MAYTPTRKRFSLPVLAFDGGLNTKYVDLNTPINQTPNCYGVEFDDFGAVQSVPGFEVLNSTPIASAPVDGLHEYVDTGGNRRLVAVCGDSAYALSGSAFSVISGSTGLYTQDNDAFIKTIGDYAYVTDGVTKPHKWDGSYFTQVGVSSVSAGVASGTTAVGLGNLNGTYRWALTGVNSAGVEGDYAIITSHIIASSQRISLTGIPTFPASAGVNTKNLYRNTAGVGSIFYKVTSLTNAATAYTDNVLDASLGDEAPSDNGAPPELEWTLEHRNRAFGSGYSSYPMRLYFSEQGEMEIWPSTNYIDIGEGVGEEITGLAVYGNSLFIHKNDGRGHGSIWGVYMPDSVDVNGTSNWYVDKVAVAEGGIGHKSITFYQNIMFFMNPFGAYAFTGQDLAKSPAYSAVGVFPTNALSFLIEPTLRSFKKSLLPRSAAIDYDNKVWLAVPESDVSNKNDAVYIFDYLRASAQDQISGAWSRMKGNVNCWSLYDGDLVAGSSEDNGYVYKWNTGHNAAGDAIDSYFYTIWLSGLPEHQDNTKTFRHMYIWYQTSGDWDLDITWWTDFSTTATGSSTINLASGGAVWDEMIWGQSKWGGGQNSKMTRLVLGTKGRVIQFRFRTNAADQHFKVIRMQLDYNLSRIRY